MTVSDLLTTLQAMPPEAQVAWMDDSYLQPCVVRRVYFATHYDGVVIMDDLATAETDLSEG